MKRKVADPVEADPDPNPDFEKTKPDPDPIFFPYSHD